MGGCLPGRTFMQVASMKECRYQVQVPNFALVLISLINVFVTCEKATRDY